MLSALGLGQGTAPSGKAFVSEEWRCKRTHSCPSFRLAMAQLSIAIAIYLDTRIVAPRRSSAVTTRVIARERVTAASVDLQWWCGWAKVSTIGAIPDGKHWQMGKLWTCRASCSPSTMVLFLPHDACIAATIGLISTTGTVGNGPSQYPAISLFILVLSLLQFLLSLLPIVMVLFTFFRGSDRIPD